MDREIYTLGFDMAPGYLVKSAEGMRRRPTCLVDSNTAPTSPKYCLFKPLSLKMSVRQGVVVGGSASCAWWYQRARGRSRTLPPWLRRRLRRESTEHCVPPELLSSAVGCRL